MYTCTKMLPRKTNCYGFYAKEDKPKYMFKETHKMLFFYLKNTNFGSMTFELWHFHKRFNANFIALCGVLLTNGIQVEEKWGNVTKYDILIPILCHFKCNNLINFNSNRVGDRNCVDFMLNDALFSSDFICVLFFVPIHWLPLKMKRLHSFSWNIEWINKPWCKQFYSSSTLIHWWN